MRLVIENRRSAFVQRDRHDVRVEHERFRQLGANATLVLPILGGDQVLGAAQAFYLKTPEQAPSADVVARGQWLLLEALANFAGSDDYAPAFKAIDEAKSTFGADWIEVLEYVADSPAPR
jgi:hypothetical protein